MKLKVLLFLACVSLFGCTKETPPLMPVEITIVSKSGILEIHYMPNKIDTLTKKQGSTTLQVVDGDVITIKRICPDGGALEYNVKTPTSSYLSILMKDGDTNRHLIPKY
ncbi:hypothetical protein [Olivibacter sp. XZL3]|uniref:hypothetical protein n=1 Tax=Olivibacter sp. XZL3 TaxID=1735116 RepID=UPI0010653FD5|nr:hypothetical protein [Olivibacter sp. XZL3]